MIVTRRTTMFFCVYPPTTQVLGWMEYVKKRHAEIGKIIAYRVKRKIAGAVVGEHGHVDAVIRQVGPKLGYSFGMIEVTATWQEERP